jgi:biotin synthase
MRTDWTRAEIAEIYNSPVLDLMYRAATVHRQHHDPQEVQVCTLLSVKTGGCPEDCAYCPQAARYHTAVKVHKLMEVDEVLTAAQRAKDTGSTRFCMGAAWREVRDNSDFDKVLDMVQGVNEMGLEVCCTLGMLTESQAQKLKDAGLYAYNHNLDTSEEYYGDIISTRTYDDRLDTLGHARKAGISVCSGGIIGMGESDQDRIGMLHTLATARIIMPKAMVRLSAGRVRMNTEEQALCFLAGANSIFAGDKLLTTPNPNEDADLQLFQTLNIRPRKAFKDASQPAVVFEQIPV